MHTQTAIHFYIYHKFYNAYILHGHKNKWYKAELKKSLVCCHSTLGLQVGLVVQDFFDFGGQSCSYFGAQSFSSTYVCDEYATHCNYCLYFHLVYFM